MSIQVYDHSFLHSWVPGELIANREGDVCVGTESSSSWRTAMVKPSSNVDSPAPLQG